MTRPSQSEIPFADKALTQPKTAAEPPQPPLERNWLTMVAEMPRPKPKPDYGRLRRRR